MDTNPIADALSRLVLGSPVVFENLAMIPLLASDASTPAYVTLDEALASGAVEITEVSEHGSVPEVRFVNRGSAPVLVVDGEELVGAKQNRVANLTILVPAQATLTIPVTCVEAGRWRTRSKTFTAAPRAQFAAGRAKRIAQVSMSMWEAGDRRSDQAEVWAGIAEKSARMGSASPTAAMEAIYAAHSSSLDAYVDGCRPVDGQAGAIFIVDGALVGFDVFDHPSTFRKLLPKLVRSVAVDAIDAKRADCDRPARPLQAALVDHFLAVAGAASRHTVKALGLGDDIRLSAPGFTGAALVVDREVVHATAFAV